MIDSYLYEPVLALMGAKPLPIILGRIVVHPPALRYWINCLDLADLPSRRLDLVEDRRPSRVTEIGSSQSKCSA